MLASLVGEHFFWITSRSAGIVALLASSATVSVGLTMSGRFVRGHLAELRATHEALSLVTIAALVLHALALLGDSFLHPSLADVAIPFASGYQRLWTTTGIVGGWIVILFGLSYYLRARIGVARWRVLHRFAALGWLLGVIHTIGEGSDAGATWFLLVAAAFVLPAAGLALARISPEEEPA